MTSVQFFVGFDYHTSFVQVCILDKSGKVKSNIKCHNSSQRIITHLKTFGELNQFKAGIEACCGAADLTAEMNKAAGMIGENRLVRLADPAVIARMKKSPDKSDFSDARIIADLARVDWLPEVWLPDAETRDLRNVVRTRQQLAKERTANKLRITAMLRNERVKLEMTSWTKAWINAVKSCNKFGVCGQFSIKAHFEKLEFNNRQIKEAELMMEQCTKNDPMVQYLLTQKGIGLVTAVVLRAELGMASRFKNGKQMARYCGLTPCNASSGKRQADAGLIRAANNDLRKVLIELAHRLVRYDGPWKTLYQNMRRAGKPACVAICAVANRWVRSQYHALKSVETAQSTEAQNSGEAQIPEPKTEEKQPEVSRSVFLTHQCRSACEGTSSPSNPDLDTSQAIVPLDRTQAGSDGFMRQSPI